MSGPKGRPAGSIHRKSGDRTVARTLDLKHPAETIGARLHAMAEAHFAKEAIVV